MTMATTEQTLKVNREKLVACMTCPLCSKLFRDATTISECLHSFCRKCIYEKITEGEIDSCPVCNTDLGCAPLEKLRADHNLQDLRIKIFPSKRRNLDAPDSVSSVPLPARRKEISLSSLAITTPKSPVKSSSSGRRSKPVPKKTLVQEEYTSPIEEPIKDVEDPPELSSEPLCRNTQTKREGDEPLPQISSCYLRVKDGRLPVSFIKRYLVKKLNLTSEAEVEISLRGQPVLSTLELHNLINWWVQTSSASERIQTVVGSSARDFVMVLSYGRKAQPP